MTTVFVVNIEKSGITETLGVYNTEKEARKQTKEYVKDMKNVSLKSIKPDEDSDETRTVLFKDKEGSNVITLNKVNSTVFQDKDKIKTKDKIKKEPSPFMAYNKENRKRITQENPEASFGEIARILGKEWKSLKEKKENPQKKKDQKED